MLAALMLAAQTPKPTIYHFTYQHRCQIHGEFIKEWKEMSLEGFDKSSKTITNLHNHIIILFPKGKHLR
jgi:hypothetical protein